MNTYRNIPSIIISVILLLLPFTGYPQETEKEAIDSARTTMIDDIKQAFLKPADSVRIYSWTVSKLGEITRIPFDTAAINYASKTLVDSRSVAMGYLGNLGSPAENKIFFGRPEREDFIFADGYWPYLQKPDQFHFMNTKVPYANITYNNGGEKGHNAEQFKGAMSMNFGKKFNIGFDFDYIYGRGMYESQSTKDINLAIYSSYISDKYDLNVLYYNTNFLNYENGGIKDDRYITDKEAIQEGGQNIPSYNIPTLFIDTWNHIKGNRFYFTHKYNVGFYQTAPGQEAASDPKKEFVPVTSFIHTFDFRSNNRRFLSHDKNIDTIYGSHHLPVDSGYVVNDRMSYWSLRNTVGIALREGFKKWAKFGLTVYADFDYRHFTLADTTMNGTLTEKIYKEFSTKIGGELAKRQGSLLTYRANAELGLTGVDLGEFKLTGEIGTKFPLWGKDISIKGKAHLLNLVPAFFERHNHSTFYWWDNNFAKTKRIYFGGELNFPYTRTKLTAGVENITNYVFFNKEGVSEQHDGNIQVFAAQLNQNFKAGILNWENEIAYQKSSSPNALPLPEFSAYSNLYIIFKIAKVLTIQPGIDVRYQTSYYAPYYDAATQQFRMQDEVKIGNFPLLNVYLNAHLKYTRFFVMGYNIGSLLFQTNYFSLAHYPLDPFYIRFGLSWNFYN
ncbi:MAG: putative porin [Bacteroidales bacterium]|nr:putative porin [Bacteroidales bacterium]